MKNLSKILISLLMGVLVFFSACEDDNDYDFDTIVPVIMSITGPDAVDAHGLTEFPTRYHVPHRGGSTFEWSVTRDSGDGATIVIDEEHSSIARIVFEQSDTDDVAHITVVETTMGGLTSEPFTTPVNLRPFCPVDMSVFAGVWDSHNLLGDEDYGVTPVEIEEVTGTLNTMSIKGFFDWVAVGFWDENWIPDVGGGGNFIIAVDCEYPNISGHQLLGETYEWGEYWIEYEGTLDPDNDIIVIYYDIAWSADGDPWNSFTATLTPSGGKNEYIVDFNYKIPEK